MSDERAYRRAAFLEEVPFHSVTAHRKSAVPSRILADNSTFLAKSDYATVYIERHDSGLDRTGSRMTYEPRSKIIRIGHEGDVSRRVVSFYDDDPQRKRSPLREPNLRTDGTRFDQSRDDALRFDQSRDTGLRLGQADRSRGEKSRFLVGGFKPGQAESGEIFDAGGRIARDAFSGRSRLVATTAGHVNQTLVEPGCMDHGAADHGQIERRRIDNVARREIDQFDVAKALGSPSNRRDGVRPCDKSVRIHTPAYWVDDDGGKNGDKNSDTTRQHEGSRFKSEHMALKQGGMMSKQGDVIVKNGDSALKHDESKPQRRGPMPMEMSRDELEMRSGTVIRHGVALGADGREKGTVGLRADERLALGKDDEGYRVGVDAWEAMEGKSKGTGIEGKLAGKSLSKRLNSGGLDRVMRIIEGQRARQGDRNAGRGPGSDGNTATTHGLPETRPTLLLHRDATFDISSDDSAGTFILDRPGDTLVVSHGPLNFERKERDLVKSKPASDHSRAFTESSGVDQSLFRRKASPDHHSYHRDWSLEHQRNQRLAAKPAPYQDLKPTPYQDLRDDRYLRSINGEKAHHRADEEVRVRAPTEHRAQGGGAGKGEIPRKVAQAPPGPVYLGFSEPDGYRSSVKPVVAASAAALEPVEVPRRTADPARHVAKPCQPDARSAEVTAQVDPLQRGVERRKPCKSDKSEITTRSWRAGLILIQERLGPAQHPSRPQQPANQTLQHSPPTRDTALHTGSQVVVASTAKTMAADMPRNVGEGSGLGEKAVGGNDASLGNGVTLGKDVGVEKSVTLEEDVTLGKHIESVASTKTVPVDHKQTNQHNRGRSQHGCSIGHKTTSASGAERHPVIMAMDRQEALGDGTAANLLQLDKNTLVDSAQKKTSSTGNNVPSRRKQDAKMTADFSLPMNKKKDEPVLMTERLAEPEQSGLGKGRNKAVTDADAVIKDREFVGVGGVAVEDRAGKGLVDKDTQSGTEHRSSIDEKGNKMAVDDVEGMTTDPTEDDETRRASKRSYPTAIVATELSSGITVVAKKKNKVPPQPPTPEQHPPARERNYDRELVRAYMERQRVERRRLDRDAQHQKALERGHKLDNLDALTRRRRGVRGGGSGGGSAGLGGASSSDALCGRGSGGSKGSAGSSMMEGDSLRSLSATAEFPDGTDGQGTAPPPSAKPQAAGSGSYQLQASGSGSSAKPRAGGSGTLAQPQASGSGSLSRSRYAERLLALQSDALSLQSKICRSTDELMAGKRERQQGVDGVMPSTNARLDPSRKNAEPATRAAVTQPDARRRLPTEGVAGIDYGMAGLVPKLSATGSMERGTVGTKAADVKGPSYGQRNSGLVLATDRNVLTGDASMSAAPFQADSALQLSFKPDPKTVPFKADNLRSEGVGLSPVADQGTRAGLGIGAPSVGSLGVSQDARAFARTGSRSNDAKPGSDIREKNVCDEVGKRVAQADFIPSEKNLSNLIPVDRNSLLAPHHSKTAPSVQIGSQSTSTAAGSGLTLKTNILGVGESRASGGIPFSTNATSRSNAAAETSVISRGFSSNNEALQKDQSVSKAVVLDRSAGKPLPPVAAHSIGSPGTADSSELIQAKSTTGFKTDTVTPSVPAQQSGKAAVPSPRSASRNGPDGMAGNTTPSLALAYVPPAATSVAPENSVALAATSVAPEHRAPVSSESVANVAPVDTSGGLTSAHLSHFNRLLQLSLTADKLRARLLGPDENGAGRLGGVGVDDSASERDVTLELDSESMTEDEVERSLRDVLPSQHLCRKLRRATSLKSVDEPPPLGGAPAALRGAAGRRAKRSGGVETSTSYDQFSVDLMRSYFTEEKVRVQHQHTVLKSKEAALIERTRADLAWLDQQAMVGGAGGARNSKGADDHYPSALREKQRDVLKHHHSRQAGLQILQQFAAQALELRRQSSTPGDASVDLLHAAAQQLADKLRESGVDLDDLADAFVDLLAGVNDPAADVSPDPAGLGESSSLGGDSVSLGGDSVSGGGESASLGGESVSLGSDQLGGSPTRDRIVQNLTMKLDKRFLTAREQKLRQRRAKAEALLAWKRRLDEEEREVLRLERQAADAKNKSDPSDRPQVDTASLDAESNLRSSLGVVRPEDIATSFADDDVGDRNKPEFLVGSENHGDGAGVRLLVNRGGQLGSDSDFGPVPGRVTSTPKSKVVVAPTYFDPSLGQSGLIADPLKLGRVDPALRKLQEEEKSTGSEGILTEQGQDNESDSSLSMKTPSSMSSRSRTRIENKNKVIDSVIRDPASNMPRVSSRIRGDLEKSDSILIVAHQVEKDVDGVNRDPESKVCQDIDTVLPSTVAIKQKYSMGDGEKAVDGEEKVSEKLKLELGSLDAKPAPKNEVDDIMKTVTQSPRLKSDNGPVASEKRVLEYPVGRTEKNTEKSTSCKSNIPKSAASENSDVETGDEISDLSEGPLSDGRKNESRHGMDSRKAQNLLDRERNDTLLFSSSASRKEEAERTEGIADPSRKSGLTPDFSRSKEQVLPSGFDDEEEDTLSKQELPAAGIEFESEDDISARVDSAAKSASFAGQSDLHHVINQAAAAVELFEVIPGAPSSSGRPAPAAKKLNAAFGPNRDAFRQEAVSSDTVSKLMNAVDAADSVSLSGDGWPDRKPGLVPAFEPHSTRDDLSKMSGDRDKTPDRQVLYDARVPDSRSTDTSAVTRDIPEDKRDVSAENVDIFRDVSAAETTSDRAMLYDAKEPDAKSGSAVLNVEKSSNGSYERDFSPDRVVLHDMETRINSADNRAGSAYNGSDVLSKFSAGGVAIVSQSEPSESAVGSMLAEAIAEMIAVRNRKREKLLQHDLEATHDNVGQEKLGQKKVGKKKVGQDGVAQEKVVQDKLIIERIELDKMGDGGKIGPRDTMEERHKEIVQEKAAALCPPTSALSSPAGVNRLLGEVMPPINSRASQPVTRPDLDARYQELIGGDGEGEWMDDDFGFSLPGKQSTGGSLPFRTETAKTAFGPASRLAPSSPSTPPPGGQPPPYTPSLVPTAPADIAPVVARALNTFWERRRYGESWRDVAPPQEFLLMLGAEQTSGGGGGVVADVSRRCFRRLTFDLVGEVLLDVYREEEGAHGVRGGSGGETRRTRRAVFGRGGTVEPPTTREALEPLVQSHVSSCFGPAATAGLGGGEGGGAKWWAGPPGGGRKKKDAVDRLLVRELLAEEPDWVDYEGEVSDIKMGLADTLLDMLLLETWHVIGDIGARR